MLGGVAAANAAAPATQAIDERKAAMLSGYSKILARVFMSEGGMSLAQPVEKEARPNAPNQRHLRGPIEEHVRNAPDWARITTGLRRARKILRFSGCPTRSANVRETEDSQYELVKSIDA